MARSTTFNCESQLLTYKMSYSKESAIPCIACVACESYQKIVIDGFAVFLFVVCCYHLLLALFAYEVDGPCFVYHVPGLLLKLEGSLVQGSPQGAQNGCYHPWMTHSNRQHVDTI